MATISPIGAVVDALDGFADARVVPPAKARDEALRFFFLASSLAAIATFTPGTGSTATRLLARRRAFRRQLRP